MSSVLQDGFAQAKVVCPLPLRRITYAWGGIHIGEDGGYGGAEPPCGEC